MKKILVSLVVLITASTALHAQENGLKMANRAGDALRAFNMSPGDDISKLEEAKQNIDLALQMPEAQADVRPWIIKGDVYSRFVELDIIRRQIDPKANPTSDEMVFEAFEAYKKGFQKASRKIDKTLAANGVSGLQSELIGASARKFEAGEYEQAFLSFRATLQSHELLSGAKTTSLLDDPAQYDEQMYFTGLAAMQAGKTHEGLVYFETLYKKGTDKPAVYEGLYKAKIDMDDQAGADRIFAEGRKKFPGHFEPD